MIYIYSISIKDNAKRYTLKNKYPSYIFYRYRCAMSPYAFPAHVCKFLWKSKDTSLFFTRSIPSPRSILLECMQVKRLVTHDLIFATPSPHLNFLPERIQSAKVPPSFVFRFFSFSYLSGVRCFFSRDLLAFSFRRFHKLARSDILEGTRKLHCVEQTGVTSNTNLLLTKFKFIDRVKNSGGSIESFQAGIYRYMVYTVLYRYLVCGGRPITHRNKKII